MAERLGPIKFQEIFAIYLDEMRQIIEVSSGCVGEFIDADIMAWWNVPLKLPKHHTLFALTAALRMQMRLKELRAQRSDFREVQVHMGLVLGEVHAGNIGSSRRMKYGLVGDSVNVASRVKCQSKSYGVSILIDEKARNAPGVKEKFHCRLVDKVIVKGKKEPTELFQLVGCRDEGLTSTDPPMEPEHCKEQYSVEDALDLQNKLIAGFGDISFQEDLKSLQNAHPERKKKDHADSEAYFSAFETLILSVFSKVLPSVNLKADWDGVREMLARMEDSMKHPKVKKTQEEINVLMGLPHNAAFVPPTKEEEFCRRFDEVRRLYEQRKFNLALRKVQAFLKQWPDDKPARILKERCETYIQDPPGPEWNGVWKLTKK
jgi:class 3 adenylate cyclase